MEYSDLFFMEQGLDKRVEFWYSSMAVIYKLTSWQYFMLIQCSIYAVDYLI